MREANYDFANLSDMDLVLMLNQLVMPDDKDFRFAILKELGDRQDRKDENKR